MREKELACKPSKVSASKPESVVEAAIPLTVEVRVLPVEERVLTVLEAVKLIIVFCADGDKERLAVMFRSPVSVVDAVRFLVKRSVKNP